MSTRCHCCGAVPDTMDTTPRYCWLCRSGCRLVAVARILRGPCCPFLKGRTFRPSPSPPEAVREPTSEARGPGEGIQRVALAASSDLAPGEFLWRGRVRRNVPGG